MGGEVPRAQAGGEIQMSADDQKRIAGEAAAQLVEAACDLGNQMAVTFQEAGERAGARAARLGPRSLFVWSCCGVFFCVSMSICVA